MADYGYEDAAPDSDKYGYGDGAPDSDPYGYGDAAPDSHRRGGGGRSNPNYYNNDVDPDPYGYGDARPDADKYGYGDAQPDSANDADKYGYGDAQPDSANAADKYGYGDGAPDDPYGYGDAAPDSAGAEYQMGYNDEPGSRNRRGDERENFRNHSRQRSNISLTSSHSAEGYGEYGDGNSEELDLRQPRRQRYRRRGSVTKYSLDAQETVQREYDAAANVIDQYREEGQDRLGRLHSSGDVSMDESGAGMEGTDSSDDGKKKKKGKKGRFRRFTIGV